jgi:GLPGLI family protein
MKTKILLLLIGVLNISILTAQGLNYEIVYSINMENFAKTFNKKENQNNAKLNNMIVDEAKRMNLKLLFSNAKSVFSEGKSMTMGNELQENLKVLVRAYSFTGAWMSDLNKKRQIFVREFENKKFFVEKPLVTRNWQYSKETKTIQGYLCHKATFVKTVPKGKFEITAWYTKDIPVALGPVDYVGELPG